MPDHTGTAIIAISEHGSPLAARLAAKLPGAKLVLADALRPIGGDAADYFTALRRRRLAAGLPRTGKLSFTAPWRRRFGLSPHI